MAPAAKVTPETPAAIPWPVRRRRVETLPAKKQRSPLWVFMVGSVVAFDVLLILLKTWECLAGGK